MQLRLERRKWGLLFVERFLCKSPSGDETYEVSCICGTLLRRTKAQLGVRKLQACSACRKQYVDEVRERKALARTKKHHANHQPTRS